MVHIHYYFTDLEFLAVKKNLPAALKQETYDFLHLKHPNPHKALFEIPSSTNPSYQVSPTQFTLIYQSYQSSTVDRWLSQLPGWGHWASPPELGANVFTGVFRGHIPQVAMLQDLPRQVLKWNK